MALAQAAIESGWGTSRFANEGNALFGQWAWQRDAGIKPLEARDERVVVRSFDDLLDSVRAYMHNLNTHRNYEDFRSKRAKMHDKPATSKTKALVQHLDGYAEIGEAYVTKVLDVIRSNDFGKFAGTKLE